MILATLAAFWPLRENEFINYDDQQYVTENAHVQRGLRPDSMRWAFTTSHASNWHPLTWLSHMLDCELFGLKPAGHHLVSLALHIANTLLLFSLLSQTTRAPIRSAMVAAIFALHPLHVESVAWVSERKDVLSSCFGLLASIAYARYAMIKREEANEENVKGNPAAQTSPRRLPYVPAAFYWAAIFLFAASLMAKPMLVTLPFLLLLLDFWPLGRLEKLSFRFLLGKDRRMLVEKVPFLALSAASCLVTIAVQRKAMVYYHALPFAYRMQNAAVSYVRYLGKALWPRNLSIVYPHPGVWPATEVVGASLLLAVVSLILFVLRHRLPYLLMGWLWFLGLLVPVIGIIQVGVQAMADRYTYLPLVGIAIMAIWGAGDFFAFRRWPVWARVAIGTAVLIGCGGQTLLQVRYWRDTETIFSHAIESTPGNWVAHHNLALLALNRYQESQRISIENQLLAAQADAGSNSPARRDYLAEVISHCEVALAAKPGLTEIHGTLAKALTERGQLDLARKHLVLIVSLTPTNAQAHQNLAEILHRQGKAGEAVVEYKATLELEPKWEPVLNNLAWLLATHPDASVRDGALAVKLAGEACHLTEFTNMWFLHTLAAAHAEAGDFSNAVQVAQQALKLASVTGQTNLVRKAEERLREYQAGHALRDP